VNESLEALARVGNGLQTRNQIFDATGSLVGNSNDEVVLALEIIITFPDATCASLATSANVVVAPLALEEARRGIDQHLLLGHQRRPRTGHRPVSIA